MFTRALRTLTFSTRTAIAMLTGVVTVAGVVVLVPTVAGAGGQASSGRGAVICCARAYDPRGGTLVLTPDEPVVIEQPSTSTTTAPSTTPSTTAPVSGSSRINIPPPLDLAGDRFTDYLTRAGDQVVVVPNGRYRGGSVTAPHAATNGELGGWLVVMAESPGGVVVDLTEADLVLAAGTSRVMFVGVHFENGAIHNDGNHIRYWYTDHTFTAEAWALDQNYAKQAPRTMYIDMRGSSHIDLYGSNIHDTGTAIVVRKARDVLLRGVHIWNLSDKGLDPNDVVHPDAIGAAQGDIQRLRVEQSHIVGRNMFITRIDHITDVHFDDVWSSGAPGVAHMFSSVATTNGVPGKITGSRRNVVSFDHNGAGKDRVDAYDGVQSSTFNAIPSRINVADHSISKTRPGSGVASPAERWRAANPYASWVNLF